MAERVVLLALDGLDWGELRAGIAAGRLPNFAALLAEGAWGEMSPRECVPGLGDDEAALNSPTLWTTVATGRYYFRHGVFDFTNIIESAENPPLFESRHVAAPRLWDILAQYGRRSSIVGYYVTHPAPSTDGVIISDMFGEVATADSVSPPARADEFARLLGAADLPALVGDAGPLGAEAAARAAADDPARSTAAAGPSPRFDAILREFTDLTGADIAALHAPQNDRQRRLLEYRLAYPLLRDERMHRLFLHLLRREPAALHCAYYRLVDFASHGFWTRDLRLPEQFLARYGNTLARSYAWADRAVGDVRALLGPADRLIVMSDHGFSAAAHTHELETCAEISTFSYGQHAEPAVLLVAGGPTRGRLPPVSLLDIAPTILEYLGVPPARSLDGGAVPGLLHESRAGAADMPDEYALAPTAAPAAFSEAEQRAVLARLAALGYVEE